MGVYEFCIRWLLALEFDLAGEVGFWWWWFFWALKVQALVRR